MYRVTWTIDVDAKSPKAAAKKAREMQRDPESTATVFEVAYHKTTQRKSGKIRSEYVTEQFDFLGE